MSAARAPAHVAAAPIATLSETRADILAAAERLFALKGFHGVSVRDITAAARANVAAVNYHFGTKDDLLFEIFRMRAAELNRERARMLHHANSRHGGRPPLREILAALFAPPIRWLHARDAQRTALQFILRVRFEGTPAMIGLLRGDVSHLGRFAAALRQAMPGAPEDLVYWRLHFCLGLVHNNRPEEFERLHRLSRGITRDSDPDAMLERMLDFAVAGFGAEHA